MRYKKCKLVCGLMVCALMMTSVTACGTNTTESSTETESTTEANTFSYTDGTEEELVSTTVMAKVDSVDGNKVTLSVGGGMEAAMEMETEAHRRSQMITATAKEGIQMCQKNQTTVEIAIMHQKIMAVLQRNHPMMDRAQANPMEMHSKHRVK